jgi:cation-transporting P-type ATPase 13A2
MNLGQTVFRFSDILPDSSALLPGAAYERDPTIDYQNHKSILYTMATCHSLRLVDGELIGDPLDLKMFRFTGWSYEEGNVAPVSFGDDERDTFSPSVARPPEGMEFDIEEGDENGNVSL